MTFSINPGQVRKILNHTETEQQALHSIIRSVKSHDSVSTTPGGTAIAEFVQAHVPPLEWIDARITAVIDGTSGALQAYDAGDQTAAAEYQRAASTIGAPMPTPRPRPQPPLGPPTPQ